MKKGIILIVAAVFAISCAKKDPEVWFCPMHKHYTSDKPGDCAICGMKLIKRESAAPAASSPPSGHDHSAMGAVTNQKSSEMSEPVKETSFKIAADKQQLIGVETVHPEMRTLTTVLKVPAQVAFESDLYAAIIEYRQLAVSAKALSESGGVSGGGLLYASRLRLRQLGLSDDEIRQFAGSEIVAQRLITGSSGGYALITLQIAESEMTMLRKNQAVSVTDAAGTKTFPGKITGISQIIDAKKRTFSVRALVRDAGASLRPQMFVTAEIKLASSRGLSVPRSAVYNTGVRKIVFLREGGETFLPREVKISGGNDEYVLIDNVKKGEEVVVSSAFLLDSEARLKIADYK